MKWRCSVCGSSNVRKTAWVNPNDNNRYITYYESTGYDFCEGCGCTKDLVETSDMTWVCEECGNPDIQIKAWVMVNSNKHVEDCPDDDGKAWCNQCDSHTNMCTKQIFDQNNKNE